MLNCVRFTSARYFSSWRFRSAGFDPSFRRGTTLKSVRARRSEPVTQSTLAEITL